MGSGGGGFKRGKQYDNTDCSLISSAVGVNRAQKGLCWGGQVV